LFITTGYYYPSINTAPQRLSDLLHYLNIFIGQGIRIHKTLFCLCFQNNAGYCLC